MIPFAVPRWANGSNNRQLNLCYLSCWRHAHLEPGVAEDDLNA